MHAARQTRLGGRPAFDGTPKRMRCFRPASRVALVAGVIALATSAAASRRGDCLLACGDAIAACTSSCDAFGDLARACRRALIKSCVRNGLAACDQASATTTTTTTTTPRGQTTTTAHVSVTTTLSMPSTTSTTLSTAVTLQVTNFVDDVCGSQDAVIVDVVVCANDGASATLALGNFRLTQSGMSHATDSCTSALTTPSACSAAITVSSGLCSSPCGLEFDLQDDGSDRLLEFNDHVHQASIVF